MRFRNRPLHRRFLVLRSTPAACLHRGPGRARPRHPAASRPRRRTWPRSKPISQQVDIPGAIVGMKTAAAGFGGLRGEYLAGLALCFEAMWDLAMEILGKGAPVPYERCVMASMRPGARAFRPRAQARTRRRTAGLRAPATASHCSPPWMPGASAARSHGVRATARRRRDRPLRRADCRVTSLPYLPAELHSVPRANIQFLPIQEAWFSGSMNYLGHARRPDGEPGVRSQLRDQRLARDLAARIPATGKPRGGARPRHHVRLPAESLLARTGGFRSVRPDHEHARRRALRRHRQQRHPDGLRRHRSGRAAGHRSANRRTAGAPAG